MFLLEEKQQTIIDETETNLGALHRKMRKIIQTSIVPKKCANELLKMNLRPQQEVCF